MKNTYLHPFTDIKGGKGTIKTQDKQVYEIGVNLIRPNADQPRRDFDIDAIVKLADSVRRYGILQPLTVRKISAANGYAYELVAGERRLRAAKLLGLATVPCLISSANDAVSAELALVENMLRENLGMFEQAEAFERLAKKYGLKQEEIASRMSLSQSAVANKMRLLRFSEEERALICEAQLTERHARAFLRIKSATARRLCIHHVIERGLNVAETDRYVTELLSRETGDKNSGKDAPKQDKKETVCANLNKYIEKLRSEHEWITVDKQTSNGETVFVLRVKRDAI